jgi:hypothetical protein
MSKLALISSCLLAVAACSADRTAGPPGAAGGTAGATFEDSDAAAEPAPSIPGVCRKLCCSSADCANGAECVAFEQESGTLGTCATDEPGEPTDGSSFGVECWSDAFPDPACNPLTAEGCETGRNTCDYDGYEVGCFGGENVRVAGESCDDGQGPWCVPGYHCVAS